LHAYAGGDRAGGLQELASLTALRSAAGRDSPLHLYIHRAGELSVAIWQQTMAQDAVRSHPDSSATDGQIFRLAAEVLGGLDLKKLADRAEACRRLDSWCGLSPPFGPPGHQASQMAN
jgi:hypothetical protein